MHRGGRGELLLDRELVLGQAARWRCCWRSKAASAGLLRQHLPLGQCWLCSGAQVVAMSGCGTCRREKACLSCMARTGLSGLMVQKRRSLQMAASHHHCHRVGAARPSHGSSSAAQLAASRAALKHGCSGMAMRAGHATAARTTGVAQQDSALAWPSARRRGVNVLSPFRSHHSWNYP